MRQGHHPERGEGGHLSVGQILRQYDEPGLQTDAPVCRGEIHPIDTHPADHRTGFRAGGAAVGQLWTKIDVNFAGSSSILGD